MFNLCMNIFDQFYDNKPIRQISIQLSNLCADIGEQLSLFDTFEEITTINQKMKQSILLKKNMEQIVYLEHLAYLMTLL